MPLQPQVAQRALIMARLELRLFLTGPGLAAALAGLIQVAQQVVALLANKAAVLVAAGLQ